MSDRLEAAVRELVGALRDELRTEDPSPSVPDRLLDVAEAAAALGVGRSLLYAEIGAGRLRSLKVGRRRLVPSSAIAGYVKASPVVEMPGEAVEVRRASAERPPAE